MHCYCANYYGAVHCQNKVTHFGQRCRLCTVLNEGTPAKDDPFKIASSYYNEDSDAMDDSSREERRRGRTIMRERSKSSSK
ncbi:uncharacterized protein F4807DRAFT_349022 [Annulohypoxylon truncatum]|uniref:uncharacterized protein n=1 Tax=Annulohypoxylon truncatum TaxID=327061 RepID=UPI0020075657|nr:uncharacterized protein F4807DRAFT_349022 [Annulohypoxylon truncatum]KAI1212772.1 hypothetical protein F4807DRAFT_349022 [Annulohypoxylon truncatum]